MFTKRAVIQKNRKIKQETVRIWFEDIDIFSKPKNIARRTKSALITSSTYRQVGLRRTLFYCSIALILFFINKTLMACFIRPLGSFGVFKEKERSPKRINDKKALVIPVIPDISHHFIYREAEELIKRGRYEVIAITKGEERYRSESLKDLLERVVYLQDISDIKFLGLLSLLYYQLTAPGRVIKLFDCYKEKNPLNLSLFNDPCNPIRGLSLARYLDKSGISYVHAFGSTIPATQALISNLLLGVSFSVTSFVDFDYDYPYKMLEEKLSRSRFFVVTTRFCKGRLNEYFKKRYSKKIFIIPAAVQLDRFSFNGRDDVNGQIKILAVGRLFEKKGFRYLIEACRILMGKKGLNFKCNIVGDGPLKEALREKIEEYDLLDRVSLIGGVTIDELRDRYSESSLLIHPGIITEAGERDGIPTSIVEAMAVGVPVIATGVSGIPELISDRVNGILVPQKNAGVLAQAIEAVISDRALRKTLVKNARERVEEFADVKKTAECLHSLIKRYSRI